MLDAERAARAHFSAAESDRASLDAFVRWVTRSKNAQERRRASGKRARTRSNSASSSGDDIASESDRAVLSISAGNPPGEPAQGASLASLKRKVDDFNRKIRREAAHFPKPNQESLTAIFLMGIPAAGKSTLTRKRYGADARYLIIDPDEIAEKLPGHSPKDPQITHGEASRLAEEQWQGALKARDRNVIFDGTGTKAEKLVRRMKEAKAAGYRTKLLYVTIPLELALRRNQERPRTVPEHIVLEKAAQINETYETVKPFADSIEEVDTTKGTNPSRVERRRSQLTAQGRSQAEVRALLAAEFPEARKAQGLTPSVRKCPNCSEAVRYNGRRTVNGRRGVLTYNCQCGKTFADAEMLR